MPDACWRHGWWAHWQHAGSGHNVVKYLARYVSRTAISDERIIAADDAAVTFKYTDSKTQQPGICQFPAGQFMRRYLQHVVPPGLHRVRYFGWMHPGARARRCIVETLLAAVITVRPKHAEPPPGHLRCRCCGKFTLVKIGTIKRGTPPPVCRPATGPPLAQCA